MADPAPLDPVDRLAVAYALAGGRTGLRLPTLDITPEDRRAIAELGPPIWDHLENTARSLAGGRTRYDQLIEQIAPKRKDPTV